MEEDRMVKTETLARISWTPKSTKVNGAAAGMAIMGAVATMTHPAQEHPDSESLGLVENHSVYARTQEDAKKFEAICEGMTSVPMSDKEFDAMCADVEDNCSVPMGAKDVDAVCEEVEAGYSVDAKKFEAICEGMTSVPMGDKESICADVEDNCLSDKEFDAICADVKDNCSVPMEELSENAAQLLRDCRKEYTDCKAMLARLTEGGDPLLIGLGEEVELLRKCEKTESTKAERYGKLFLVLHKFRHECAETSYEVYKKTTFKIEQWPAMRRRWEDLVVPSFEPHAFHELWTDKGLRQSLKSFAVKWEEVLIRPYWEVTAVSEGFMTKYTSEFMMNLLEPLAFRAYSSPDAVKFNTEMFHMNSRFEEIQNLRSDYARRFGLATLEDQKRMLLEVVPILKCFRDTRRDKTRVKEMVKEMKDLLLRLPLDETKMSCLENALDLLPREVMALLSENLLTRYVNTHQAAKQPPGADFRNNMMKYLRDDAMELLMICEPLLQATPDDGEKLNFALSECEALRGEEGRFPGIRELVSKAIPEVEVVQKFREQCVEAAYNIDKENRKRLMYCDIPLFEPRSVHTLWTKTLRGSLRGAATVWKDILLRPYWEMTAVSKGFLTKYSSQFMSTLLKPASRLSLLHPNENKISMSKLPHEQGHYVEGYVLTSDYARRFGLATLEDQKRMLLDVVPILKCYNEEMCPSTMLELIKRQMTPISDVPTQSTTLSAADTPSLRKRKSETPTTQVSVVQTQRQRMALPAADADQTTSGLRQMTLSADSHLNPRVDTFERKPQPPVGGIAASFLPQLPPSSGQPGAIIAERRARSRSSAKEQRSAKERRKSSAKKRRKSKFRRKRMKSSRKTKCSRGWKNGRLLV